MMMGRGKSEIPAFANISWLCLRIALLFTVLFLALCFGFACGPGLCAVYASWYGFGFMRCRVTWSPSYDMVWYPYRRE